MDFTRNLTTRIHLPCALILLLAAPALAQADGRPTADAPQPTWSVSLGAAVNYGPDYKGSDDFKTQALPWIDVAYGDLFFIRLPEGIGVNLIRGSQLTAGLAIGYGGGRKDEGDLSLIEEVDNGALVQAFIKYKVGAAKLSATVITALSGDNEGQAADVGVTFSGSLNRRWIYSAGPNLRWHSKAWNDALFSLSPAEASQLGTASYSAGSGISEIGARGVLTYLWNRRISTTAIVRVSRLLGEAADSPIVKTLGRTTQPAITLVAAYRF